MEGQLTLFDMKEIGTTPIPSVEREKTEQQDSTLPKSNEGFGIDLLSKFDDLRIDKTSVISDADKVVCEDLQQRIDAAMKLIQKAKKFYKENEMSNIFLSTKNLVNALEEKQNSKIESFIKKITSHFKATYSVTIDSGKFRKFDQSNIRYENILEDILLQMDGMNFYEKACDEIKKSIRATIYNHEKVKVKSLKVTIADFMRFDTWGETTFRNESSEKLAAMFTAIELFESGKTVLRDSFKEITKSTIRSDWFEEFNFTGLNKFESVKCYRNGKLEVKFKTHDYAMEFAKTYLKYM